MINMHYVTIDGQIDGRTFDGLGALSAGATSRLLKDYAACGHANELKDLLDYLFYDGDDPARPKGACFHMLKVENGGDANSTCGCEPSYARSREEFDNHRPEYYKRGYEFWLMREAKDRNPSIKLTSLQWGAPGWIGSFYSQDNASYVTRFIEAAKEYWGLDIDYIASNKNEDISCRYDVPPEVIHYIKNILRPTLDHHGLSHVKIIACDGGYDHNWCLADYLVPGEPGYDQELYDAVDIVGFHYPWWQGSVESWVLGATSGFYDSTPYKNAPTPNTLKCAKTLWASEDYWSDETWKNGLIYARCVNRNYVDAKITASLVCVPVDSYMGGGPGGYDGPVLADEPWSGNYFIGPALWCMAHTTQFAKPGWIYLEGEACGMFSEPDPHDRGYFVTMKDPDTGDYSIIIATGTTSPGRMAFKITGGLKTADMPHLWVSNEEAQFIKRDGLLTGDGSSFNFDADANTIYSITTTTGQRKGSVARTIIPPESAPFPFPYFEDFERYEADTSETPLFISDMYGAFDIAQDEEGNKVLRQQVIEEPLHWAGTGMPHTRLYMGVLESFAFNCDVKVADHGTVTFSARPGLKLQIDTGGNWVVSGENTPAGSGTILFRAEIWHHINMEVSGESITIFIDNTCIGTYQCSISQTWIEVGTHWNRADFDNIKVF